MSLHENNDKKINEIYNEGFKEGYNESKNREYHTGYKQ
jgi:hypothetical protein